MNITITARSKLISGLVFALALAAGPATGTGDEAGMAAGNSDHPTFSTLSGYQLQPDSKTLKTGARQALRVVNCSPPEVGAEELALLWHAGKDIYECEAVSPATISDWSVNGIVGGNTSIGTITGSRDTATYTAPATKPNPATVAVSAKVNLKGSLNTLMVSNITITDLSKYSGTVKFSSKAPTGGGIGVGITNGTATVTWTLEEELPDVRTYIASGTISGDLAPEMEDVNCKPVPVSGKIESGDKLVVYTERANWNPATYSFGLVMADRDTMLTTKCTDENGGEFPISFPNLLMALVGGNCLPDMTPRPVPFTDPEVLQGSFDCPGNEYFAGLSAQWTFTAE